MTNTVHSIQQPRRRPWARALVFFLTQALVLQPAAFAASWNIAQQPLFTINPVYPNAVFMIDDSWSMNDYRLPPPQFFSVNNRWPQGPTVTVRYGGTTRTVASQTEFTLRSSIHNPLAYDPAITYTPWNDNDKPKATQGTRPDRSESFPPASIGGTQSIADVDQLTERDMRFRGFANGSPTAARNWITRARGSVGFSTGPTGNYASGSLAGDRWAWNDSNKRWEQPITNPAGTAIYPPFPGDGPQAADLFTNPPVVCTAPPPCIDWNTADQTRCVETERRVTGTQQVCLEYIDQPVFGQVCTQTEPVITGYRNGACTDLRRVQTGTTNGACLQPDFEDVYRDVTTCNMENRTDPTSETGYRLVQVCTTNRVFVERRPICRLYEQIPVMGDRCYAYEQIPIWGQRCIAWGNQQTGTQRVCNRTGTQDVYGDFCIRSETVTVNTTCRRTDPAFVCPPQNISSDNLTPARYYRYEGPVPASDDDLAAPANYRLVEVDRAVNSNFPVPVDPRTGAVRNRVDCQTFAANPPNDPVGSAVCTRLEEMQNYANWFTYYRHRLFAAMAVTSQAASDLKGDLSAIRLGYGRINYFNNGPDPWNPYGARLNGASFPELDNDPQPPAHPGALVRGVRDFTDTPGNPARQQFFDWIFSLNWVGSTPNREALDSIGTYYLRGTDFGPWSDNPGNGGGRQGDQHASCRRSFAILATDGEWTAIPESPPAPPAQPLIANRTADPVGAGNGTVTASLAATGPQIDGAGLYQGQTYTYDPSVEVQYSTGNGGVTQTLTDVALYWWNRDLRPGVPNAVQKRTNRPDDSFWQNMTTFVVGYGLSASMDTPAVRAQIAAGQAVNWPIVDISPALTTGGERVNDTMRAALATRGDFYSANDPDQMRGRIRGVFRAIAQQAFSGTGLGATSAQLTVGSTLYRASFTTQTWTGELAAYDAMALALAARTQQPEPAALWTAGFPAWDQRKIFTSTGPNAARAFDTLTSLDATQQAALTSQEVLEYIRGRKLGLEVSSPVNRRTLGFRDRTTLLGSIVSSSPRYSKAPNFGYSLNPAAGGGSVYKDHVAANAANRRPTVFVGANAGMFHAFDARRDPNVGGGQELFAYVPRAVYPHLKELTNVEYVHRYFVDGPVVEGDVYLNSAWKTVVMGSTGAGPAGLFALDVTSPENFDDSKVLWDITPAEEPDLGRVMGHGYIGSVKYQQTGGKWVAIVPNGYESANNRAVLLIIDMATGQTLRKIDTCKRNDGTSFGANEQGGRCRANELNGLANVSVIYDASRNVVGAFSGDYQGNVWRFDLSSSDPAQWRIATEDPADQTGNTPAPLFTATNSANQRQPVVAAPRASTHPFGGTYLVFGTGKFFEYTDQSSTELQSIYGLWLKPGDKAPIAKADLQGLGLDESTQNNVVVRTLSGTSGFSWRTKRGWYVNLVANNQSPLGERVIADPVVQRGVLFMTSFQPTTAGNPCEGGGTSYFYAIGMDASLNSFSSTQVSGVVSSVYPMTNETAVSGQPDTNINLGEASSAMSDTSRTRDANGNVSISNPALQCWMMYNQVNVQAGLVDRACNYAFPVRTWRPIR